MLLAALLLMQAAPQASESAVDAERAFNRMAQTQGQWTAFRAFAAPDAVVFTPQPANPHAVLPAKNPSISVQWWPAESYVSCDGQMAVNTGPWVRPKSVGYFTTVWARQAGGGWKWLLDHGDDLKTPRALPERPRVTRASCSGKPTQDPILSDERQGGGRSPDRTLGWMWKVRPDGSRTFWAAIWTGKRWKTVIDDRVMAEATK